MTLGTGRKRALRRNAGFTLIEIIVVMAIIVVLVGLVLVSARGILGQGYQRNTEARIRMIEEHLEKYRELTGKYPPDGFDSPQKNDQGTKIHGSACLHYFLSRPVRVERKVAGRLEVDEHPAIYQFNQSELGDESPDAPGVRELVDGWDTPFHYDNTEDGRFEAQTFAAHIPEADEETHSEDPRTGEFIVDGKNAVEKPGIQGKGFDIWSHGEQGHESSEAKSLPIATWTLER
jgi:prepilin-type N-terminal cleavage/methylation domain-containing protein